MNGDFLSALALLKTNYDENGTTYLDYIAPFVADSIRASDQSAIERSQVPRLVVERYGIDIPSGVANTVLKRLVRRGYGKFQHHEFIPDVSNIRADYDLEPTRRDAHAQIAQLAATFIAFAQDQAGLELTEEQANRALTGYATHHGTEILRRALHQEPLSQSLDINEVNYVTSKFIIHAFEEDLPESGTLLVIAKSSKLVGALYLPFAHEIDRRISNLTAILDTRTVLSALGYHSEMAQKSAQEMLDLAYASRVQLAIFEDTISEIESVLHAAQHSNHRGRYGRSPSHNVSRRFFELGYTSSDVLLLISQIPSNISSLRIKIITRPSIESRFAIDEIALENALSDRVRYPSREPLLHDLDVLTATFRLRRGHRGKGLEDCRAQFVSPNSPMVAVARHFFYREENETWPVALTEDEFVTLLWLKHPVSIPDFPLQRVIGDAYAALEPSAVNWNRYLDELEKLVDRAELTEDDYAFFRYSSTAREAIADHTKGKTLRPSDVSEIIRRVRAQIEAPMRDNIEEQQRELTSTRDWATRQQKEREQAVTERDAANAELAKKRRKEVETRKRIHQRAMNWARRIRRSFVALLMALTVVGSAASVFLVPALNPETPTVARIVVWALTGTALTVFAYNALTGNSIAASLRRMELHWGRWRERRLLSALGLVSKPR